MIHRLPALLALLAGVALAAGCVFDTVEMPVVDSLDAEDGNDDAGPITCVEAPELCAPTEVCEGEGEDAHCTCRSGYAPEGVRGACVDVDECLEDPCDPHASCENTNGAYRCTCEDGYAGDGLSCENVDECLQGTDTCADYASCDDTDGSYHCTCAPGFVGDGETCDDIDECAGDETLCDPMAVCENAPGGYVCRCELPYVGDGYTCALAWDCSPELAEPAVCSPEAECVEVGDRWYCTCKDGFMGNGLGCEDVNECDTRHPCDPHARCENTFGGYRCDCDEGWDGDGLYCDDVDECTEVPGRCDPVAACENTEGGFVCTCPDGYTGTGETCHDVDECALGTATCDTVATCVNTAGSYACDCPYGWIDVDGDGRRCVLPTTCNALHIYDASLPSGMYRIDPDGVGGVDAFRVGCDMTNNGGGWTIVYAASGADGEVPMVHNASRTGNPLSFEHFNLTHAQKVAIAEVSSRSIFVRGSGAWIVANHALFDARLLTADQHVHYSVNLVASDGTRANGSWMGWTNFRYAAGGDFYVTREDGETCSGETHNGVDHHNNSYYHLNCGCRRHYLYSYSASNSDWDAGYDVHNDLGSWTATQSCDRGEGGALHFYAGMR